MTPYDAPRPRACAERTDRGAPWVTRGRATGRPRRPRGHRRRPVWAVLAAAVAVIVAGIVLRHIWLLAAGLITAGVAAHLLAPPHDPAGHHRHHLFRHRR